MYENFFRGRKVAIISFKRFLILKAEKYTSKILFLLALVEQKNQMSRISILEFHGTFGTLVLPFILTYKEKLVNQPFA
jgi:hypothetical protein